MVFLVPMSTRNKSHPVVCERPWYTMCPLDDQSVGNLDTFDVTTGAASWFVRTGFMNMSDSVCSSAANATDEPSGAHTGNRSLTGPTVSRPGVRRSTSINHRLSASCSDSRRATTTVRSSDERRG